MKITYVKFYVGARIGGKVITHVNALEKGAQQMELAPNLGIILRGKKNTTDKEGRDVTVDDTILVPFNNVAYCEIEEPVKEALVKKAAK